MGWFMIQYYRGGQKRLLYYMVGRIEMDTRGFLIVEEDVTAIGIRLYTHTLSRSAASTLRALG
ncbi:hypothetical protein FOMPIDRAFT_91980 [Fomitopsis schrenkii]|uniref:Uncharacterized protein n=1 Tax=Fomitopsis schrenkii TaxID=2126942 RepID=S8DMH9_FOMSC|nr:hypothetical protein FOMPIDRAFT_91980 [Fomitopsis schrenkii]